MAPRLDLTHSTHHHHHHKIMVAPPRINLRRAASYNNSGQDRGSSAPLSATSSRFNFNHLLFSPPPSPSLPALVPRPKRSPSQIFKARPRRLLRHLLYLVTIVSALYVVAFACWHRDAIPAVLPHFAGGRGGVQFEMVGQDVLPDFPTPIVVTDSKRRSKWTVAIPHGYEFPLSIKEYAGMGGRCREVSSHARELSHKAPLSADTMLAYDKPDDYFIDVAEAERSGLLPGASKGAARPQRSGHFVGLDWEAMAGKPVCDRSLTYVMESRDAGLGRSMMALWTLYALAKEQGRAFFIDDSRWAYGAYTDLFQAPPLPDCRPPPRHHMLPCPVQARHLVVSGVTSQDAYPALMARHRRSTGAHSTQHDLLELARTGYKALFTLNKGDQEYVDKRIRELEAKAKSADTSSQDAPIIGIHIRRGDAHPLEYQYRDTYIPAEVFVGHAHRLAEAHYNNSSRSSSGSSSKGAKGEGEGVQQLLQQQQPQQHRAVMVIASDDPMVSKEADFSDAHLAQKRIRLATKEEAKGQHDGDPNPHVLHQFKEEAQGWEGGFFAPMFWNLGAERKNNAAATAAPGSDDYDDGDGVRRHAEPPSEQTLKLRSFLGRAYAMDLAVLAGASDKVVCAVSATGCKLLGVMLGWERGMERGAWVNIDGGYSWSGLSW
ncbi:hypothetical protein JDV02_007125 [Purpureocillium takamizusanense]|uniref:Uncharacterized protein n=1 Tax=Purpureocillium takamizusanense TaxID=2060973 RepID=A0A9Q8VDS8_9HYPO|nr:uncharacterized protein JDV02_007125 [Purpureocillium takamizusanense]UNI21107.1 hypothetical protein JDV02_007125 [Purpureocillium takamizusanense]